MLTISEEQKKNIFKCLKELSTCDRCILRYLGYTMYEHGKEYLKPENVLDAFYNEDKESSNEYKRLKKNPCRSCLNVLSDSVIENYTSVITDDFKDYQMQDYYTTLNFPICLYVREFGMFLYLKEKYPEIYKKFLDIEKIKKVFRIISSNVFSLKLKRPFKDDSNFQININIIYDDEQREIENLKKLISNKNISKKIIEDFLSTSCSDELFKKHFPVPPSIQDKETYATATFSSSILYLGGRYLKFSRDMGQTPFIVNNIPITECSVQEVIFNSIVKVLRCDKKNLTFCASGREDADTRMVGNGRPFYVQIDAPFFEKITFEQCRDIEAIIAQSNTVVVTKLQQVNHESTKQIKFGEQEKRKHYRALCKSLAPDIEAAIKIINQLSCPLDLQQATPIRVLHRRTHLIRDKKLYKVKASPVEGFSQLFYLDIISAAGTYIKEFVNGDFHRTNPNLCKLTGYPVDVVALDVSAIELDWPIDR